MSNEWDADQYRLFASERAAPFFDLLGLIKPVPSPRVVDLGCGTGELTVQAHNQLHASETLGIDNSAAMLQRARQLHVEGVVFRHEDIASFSATEPFDIVLSNAALHWLPDHAAQLAAWSKWLGDEGQLAVQLPANGDHPSHRVAAELCNESPFAEVFDAAPLDDPMTRVLNAETYAEILDHLGYRDQHVRLQVYAHRLASSSDVVEWTKGTTLTRVKARLTPELYEEFLARYRERLIARIGDHRPYLYTFKRILFWACR